VSLLLDIHDDDNEIAIPSCLADSNLTLSEIGVLFCLTAIAETGKGIHRFDRGDSEFLDAMKELKKKGILTMNLTGNNLKLHIDLDKVQTALPESPQSESEVSK